MYCLNKENKKIKISNDKIIELYSSGWSINDIVLNYKTNVRYVRNVLQEIGIDTSNYRTTSDFIRNCIMQMVVTGLSVRKIAYIIDVSPHLIRQVLRHNKINVSNLRADNSDFVVSSSISEDKWISFYDLYKSGKFGFIKCAEMCELSVLECCEAIFRLTENDIIIHHNILNNHIAAQCNAGLSPTSVGKQLGVSTSIVKHIFNKEILKTES